MAAALTACGHRASTDSGVDADSVSIDSTAVANEVALLKTDSIGIELTDTMANVHVSVDWPVEGNDTLLQGIRQYILKQLGIKKCTDIKAEIKKVAKTQYHELKTQWQEDRECRGEDMGMIYSSYQRISVDDVVALVPMSRRLLEGTFRREMGTSIYQYIIKVRVEKMKDLMVNGYSPLAAADILGMDYKIIARSFKKLNGITPGEFADNIE